MTNHRLMLRLVLVLGVVLLARPGPLHGELDLPSALPTSAFLAMDAVVTDVQATRDSLTISFRGKLAMPHELMGYEQGKPDEHRVVIRLSTPKEIGAFLQLTEKAESLSGKICVIDIVTASYRYGGSSILFDYATSKIDIRSAARQ